MSTLPKPVSQFKIWDWGKKTFYMVTIFATKKEMYQHHDYYWTTKTNHKYLAITKGCDSITIVDGKSKKSQFIGEIILCFDALKSGIVSHEMAHATLYWYLKKYSIKRLPETKFDEKFAWQLGFYVQQFWYKFYRYLNKRLKIK